MAYVYNTSRKPLILKEYGRNIQKLVDFIKSQDTKEQRTQYAYTLVNLMKQIVPSSKDSQENEQKFWDDLFIVADFELDIDAPYPCPESNILTKKPDKLKYHTNAVKYRHYGRNIELLIQQAIDMEDQEKKTDAVLYIGKLMKTFHTTWSKDTVDDSVILKNIKLLSQGKLDVSQEIMDEGEVFNALYRDTKRSTSSSGKGGGGKSKRGSQGRQNRRRRSN